MSWTSCARSRGCRICGTSSSAENQIADVRALPGIRYYLARVGDPSTVVAPPYDVISDSQLARYEALSPYNVVRLTRPGHDYERASNTFEDWQREGILKADPASMYVHEVRFNGRRRLDLIAALRLQPYEDRVVLPHERTHRGPKEDRLALLRATNANLEPLWFLYEGRASGVPQIAEVGSRRDPAVTFKGPEETEHPLWVIADPTLHAVVHAAFETLPVLIADGHHRYETALAHSAEVGGDPDAASRFTLALLTDLDDPGLEVLPTHRVLKAGVAVTGGEDMPSLQATLEALRGRVAAGSYRDHRFQLLPLEGGVALAGVRK